MEQKSGRHVLVKEVKNLYLEKPRIGVLRACSAPKKMSRNSREKDT